MRTTGKYRNKLLLLSNYSIKIHEHFIKIVYVSFESIVHENVWPLYRNTRVVHAQWSVESY